MPEHPFDPFTPLEAQLDRDQGAMVTGVQLHDGFGGFSADLFCTYSDVGIDITTNSPGSGAGVPSPLACNGCRIQPADGAMSDFDDELTDGDWTLEMTSFETGTLNG